MNISELMEKRAELLERLASLSDEAYGQWLRRYRSDKELGTTERADAKAGWDAAENQIKTYETELDLVERAIKYRAHTKDGRVEIIGPILGALGEMAHLEGVEITTGEEDATPPWTDFVDPVPPEIQALKEKVDREGFEAAGASSDEESPPKKRVRRTPHAAAKKQPN